MTEFLKGDRVQFIHKDDNRYTQEAKVTGFHFDEDLRTYEVEVQLDNGRFEYRLPGLLQRVDEYEYAYQKSFGHINRRIDEEEWTTKVAAQEQLRSRNDWGLDPTWGEWTAKVVKRRKAGPIQDV